MSQESTLATDHAAAERIFFSALIFLFYFFLQIAPTWKTSA